MKEATVFENLLLINAEINQTYVYPNLEKNRVVRFFYRHITSWYRRKLLKRIDRYEHNSFAEMISFLENCYRMYPPRGEFKNIHSIIIMENRCTSSIIELNVDETIGDKHIQQLVYTLTCMSDNPNECELVATAVHDDGSNRYIMNIKSFDPGQIDAIQKVSIMQKRILEFLLVRLHDILLSNARMFLRNEVHRSERIEL